MKYIQKHMFFLCKNTCFLEFVCVFCVFVCVLCFFMYFYKPKNKNTCFFEFSCLFVLFLFCLFLACFCRTNNKHTCYFCVFLQNKSAKPYVSFVFCWEMLSLCRDKVPTGDPSVGTKSPRDTPPSGLCPHGGLLRLDFVPTPTPYVYVFFAFSCVFFCVVLWFSYVFMYFCKNKM